MGIHVVLKMICVVVFLVYLVVWTLIPLKVYRNVWSIKLGSHFNTTYFREQGTNIVLYSVPLMFIAALNCIYLHLQAKNSTKDNPSDSKSDTNSPKRAFASLRRPVCVSAPLGIVSAVELFFAATFIVLLAWSLGNYIYISFGMIRLRVVGETVWQAKLRAVSLRLGYIGNTCWAFLFFPVTRGSSILPLFGLTSESSIKYHIWLGHISNILFVLHTVGFFVYWGLTNQMYLALGWSSTYLSNFAGVIATAIAVVMWVTSLNGIRRKMFELFFYTHQLYIAYIVFYVLHVGSAFFIMVLPGIFLFIIDRYLRFLQSRDRARLLAARLLPGGAIELNFSKTPGLKYNPTSIMFLSVPSVSKLQWHPFTVTSNCNSEPEVLSVVIKGVGSWCQKLHDQLSSSSLGHLPVSVEGPYGPSSFLFLRHKSLIMVCGGSGITPFISIIREVLFQSTKPKTHIPNILLVCAFKTSADLSMLDLLLPISGSNADQISQIQLRIEAYVTQENERPNLEAQKQLQTIRFKPSPLDSPISATLGPNNWLWLGAIIVSSFLLFLVVLGFVTRYYIYPYDQIVGQFYHYSYRCLWDMLLVCACIWVVSSVAFVLCKRRNAKERNQIKNVEMVATPGTSPAMWSYSATELESLPNQSLAEAINVHFGARPDLKKILFESKASDVGVLVCGPRKMRHEVAGICSSGLADNLHFESISFNW